MFDAKGMLDALMRGGAQPQGQQVGFGALEALLRQLVRGGQNSQTSDGVPRDRAQRREDGPDERGGALPGPTMRGERGEAADERKAAGSQRTFANENVQTGQNGNPPQQSAGGLEDLLRAAMGGQAGSLSDIVGKLQQQAGGLAGILAQVLGQATSGVREGAQRIDDATGATRYARDAVGQVTGRTPDELLAQLKQLAANNQLATGTALGSLGALVLGTGAGRSLAGSAVKLGSLALIGGLAYKAFQNYQQGQPVLGAQPQPQALMAAPEGSGFEPGAVTDEHATLLIRAMIAAAAADGRIDEKEQQKILAGLQQADLGGDARQFLAREIKNPATVDDLANAVSSPEEGVRVYAAARIAVDPAIEQEHEFLVVLANRLGIDNNLAAHIDAAARGAGT